MKILACIPARFRSTRFAGKVLAKDTGKFLIQHTWEQACQAGLLDKVIIAADDKRIVAAARSFGAECVLTSADHKSGTDRIAEAVKKIADSNSLERIGKEKLNANDIVVNLQADEPEIEPESIDYLAKLLRGNQQCQMATLVAGFESPEQVKDPNIVKVVVDSNNYALYFSRSVIPYDREKFGAGETKQYLRHVGIYAYRKDFLLKITSMPQSSLERSEKLEQLRAIENGHSILVGKVEHFCEGIDTPQQYAEFVKRYKKATEKKE